VKLVTPTVEFAVRTVKGERRRIRSFLRQIETLGVQTEDLPAAPVRTLQEADVLLGRYQEIFGKETPTEEQLRGVMEDLGGIDRIVRSAMSDILKALGWRPEKGKDPRGELPPWDDEAVDGETDGPEAEEGLVPGTKAPAGSSSRPSGRPAAARGPRRSAGRSIQPPGGPSSGPSDGSQSASPAPSPDRRSAVPTAASPAARPSSGKSEKDSKGGEGGKVIPFPGPRQRGRKP
jgi:hypothetical protein